jgi:uncharacterized membrane protein YjjP (DUF1212 family)
MVSLLSLIILICCAIIFYRIGESDYGRGGLVCILGIVVGFVSYYLIPHYLRARPFVYLIIGQVLLFVALVVYNLIRKRPLS